MVFEYSYLKESAVKEQLKWMQSCKLSMWKGYHLSLEGIRKGYFFCQKWYIKGWDVGPRGRTSPYKTLFRRSLYLPLFSKKFIVIYCTTICKQTRRGSLTVEELFLLFFCFLTLHNKKAGLKILEYIVHNKTRSNNACVISYPDLPLQDRVRSGYESNVCPA